MTQNKNAEQPAQGRAVVLCGHLCEPTCHLREVPPTQFGEDDEVLCIALWAGHARCAVAPLFLVHPALQAGLVNPLGGAAAATRAHPLCRAVVLICGEAHPAAPERTNTHKHTKSIIHV